MSSPSSSSSQSPPRKRVKQSMIADATNSPPPPSSSSSAAVDGDVSDAVAGGSKLKLRQERRSSASAMSDVYFDGEDVDEREYVPASSASPQQQLLRKVPRRKEQLSPADREVIRLIGQHLTNIGLKTSAEVLMHEAGCRLDHPTAALFRKLVMNGDWVQAVRTLDDLKDHLEHPRNLTEMKFLLLEQKYLELLAQQNIVEALKVLQKELTPLKHSQNRTHELASYLMLSRADDISHVTRDVCRQDLMERLQSFLPASIMLPPRRLAALLQQAAEYQSDRCLFHKQSGLALDPEYLSVDHQCSREDFPCETLQTLGEHNEEVWYCKFSPDGLKLATGSKDHTVIVWDFDPDTLTVRRSRTLERQSHGVSFFSWSPDSIRLAICGPEDCDEVCIYNVETGASEGKIAHSTEDSLTAVSWSPCGNKLTCGGNRGNFYQCDTKGTVNDSWEGVRVQALAYRRDGKSILAADTHHRIRSYCFDDLTDCSVLQEDQGIMSFSIDESDRYALLNIANQGLHLWDIKDHTLVRKFKGVTQGFYTIHSCFGGGREEQNFVASGSEDTKVYVYHVKREEPIAVLSGHGRTVNCVSWNPVYPRVLASASDDGTVRLWGPAERFRKQDRQYSSQLASAAKIRRNGSVENGANGVA